MQKQEDVSALPPYKSHVGSSYALKQEMRLAGVTAPPGSETTVDYYVITPISPGWSGPEVITREALPAGTIVQVEAVYRCVNCLFEKPLKAKVAMPGHGSNLNRPVYIPLKFLSAEWVEKH
ncbi:MAG: hypothetical protein IT582_09610 [Opitutaceae bacterium]|nr:hypothetical protein [Opitutaceae bacterium]